jgi:hypothetical protein
VTHAATPHESASPASTSCMRFGQSHHLHIDEMYYLETWERLFLVVVTHNELTNAAIVLAIGISQLGVQLPTTRDSSGNLDLFEARKAKVTLWCRCPSDAR